MLEYRYLICVHDAFLKEKEQTTQWAKGQTQRDKQRSTKHTYKAKDRETRTPLKIGGDLR
jgi:hypothetical protein